MADAFWSDPPERLIEALASTREGLTTDAALERLRRFGPNAVRQPARLAVLRLFARQFESPLIAILIFAAVVAALLRDWTDAVIVLAILLGSGMLGFAQEYRASAAVERLRSRVRARSTVLRDGVPAAIPIDEVVPGDVVLLAAGSLIPGDGVLLEARDLFVSEAALTGEAFPVEKSPGPCAADAPIAARRGSAFLGTSVRSGTARMLVVRTGAATAYGAIAERLRLRPPETEFERGVRHYGYLLMRMVVLLTLVVFAANVFLERPRLESLLFALALAVGISPELLPAIIQVTLARGAREMAAHGVVVRQLEAIENFGSMDVLCTDKTATLTEGVLVLAGARDAGGAESGVVLEAAWQNAALQTGLTSPLDDAIREAAERCGIALAPPAKLDEIPYDFVRRRVSVVLRDETGGARLVAKGAFEGVLEACRSVRDSGREAPLDGAARARIRARFAAWSAEGLRVLAVATRAFPVRERWSRDDERDLVFEGFLLFEDPPKPGVGATLAALRALGVSIKVITGDNRLVTLHVAREIGIESPRVLDGRELAELGDEALLRRVTATDLFVEVDPNQKERILLALKKAGHVVGFLGDGINDASALHAADVGISVDGAVDVAKEAAEFVLLEHDLDVLRRGIEHGRAALANTLKYVSITTSANFGNMLSMAAASFFLPFLPLLAKQILLNNLLSDLPAIGIPSDRVDPDRIERPRRWDVRAIRNFMLVFGLISTFFDLLTFGVLWLLVRGDAALFRTGWFVESLLTELVIVLVVRSQLPVHRTRPGRLLTIATLGVAALAVAIPYLPGREVFEFVPLSPAALAAVVGITLAYAAASELAKRRFTVP